MSVSTRRRHPQTSAAACRNVHSSGFQHGAADWSPGRGIIFTLDYCFVLLGLKIVCGHAPCPPMQYIIAYILHIYMRSHARCPLGQSVSTQAVYSFKDLFCLTLSLPVAGGLCLMSSHVSYVLACVSMVTWLSSRPDYAVVVLFFLTVQDVNVPLFEYHRS